MEMKLLNQYMNLAMILVYLAIVREVKKQMLALNVKMI